MPCCTSHAAFVKAMKHDRPVPHVPHPVAGRRRLAVLARNWVNDARGIGISQVVPYPWNDTIGVVRGVPEAARQAEGQVLLLRPGGLHRPPLIDRGAEEDRQGPDPRKAGQCSSKACNFDLGGYKVNYGPTSRNGSRYVEPHRGRGRRQVISERLPAPTKQRAPTASRRVVALSQARRQVVPCGVSSRAIPSAISSAADTVGLGEITRFLGCRTIAIICRDGRLVKPASSGAALQVSHRLPFEQAEPPPGP